jgi:putative inorganic carbon (HCO3(-)) transporter
VAIASSKNYSSTQLRNPLLVASGLTVLALATFIGSIDAIAAGLLVGVVVAVAFVGQGIRDPFPLIVGMAFLIPFNFIVVVGPIPLAAELLKIAIWGPLLLFAVRRQCKITGGSYFYPFLLLSFLVMLSCLRAQNLAYSLKESVRLLSSAALCFVLPPLVDTPERFRLVVKTLVVSGMIVAAYGLYQFCIQDFGFLFWIVNPRLNTAFAPSRTEFWEWRNRIVSVLSSEMEAGDYFACCLPFAVAMIYACRQQAKRGLWIVASLVISVALLLTFTFGAWIGTLTAFGMVGLYFRKQIGWRRIVIVTFVCFSAAAVFAILNLNFLVDKIGQVAWDYATRLELWLIAISAFLSHPLTGVGIGNYASLGQNAEIAWLADAWAASITPHNMYLYMLSQMGLLGTLSIVGVFVHSIRTMLKLRPIPDVTEFLAFRLAIASAILIVLVVGLADDSAIFGPHTSYLVWFIVAMGESLRRITTPQGTLA